jgi:hypothetical protein
MKLTSRLLSLLMLSVLAIPAQADDSGAFVVRLGSDTTSVERYARSKDKLEVDQVGRAPRTLRRKFTYLYADGAIARLDMVVTPPGAMAATQTIAAIFDSDSMRATIQNGAAPVQHLTVAMPRGTLVIAGSSPWASYERELAKFVKSKADTVGGMLYYLGSAVVERYRFARLGRDSIEISNTHGDNYHAAVDKAGHILGTLPIAGTAKFGITRVATLDLDGLAATFMAREQGGAGVGMLSPRDSVRVANAGGAAITIDYGRPGKRGRVVYGGVVPYGEVWRTGANAATQFRTDKALDFGGSILPPGFYTLWTIPGATSWKLVINSETGQWGTAHKADKDLLTLDMKVSGLPSPVERFTISVDVTDLGGVLNLDWDATRASAAFTVKP